MRPGLIITVGLILGSSVFPRGLPDDNRTVQLKATAPAFCGADHRTGRLQFTVSNNGTFGSGFLGSARQDCFTGETVVSAEFPVGSNHQYLWGGALWIGAVIGDDTLVTTGADGWLFGNEFVPPEAPGGVMYQRSTTDPNPPPQAVSEQDIVAVYSDTIVPGVNNTAPDYLDGRPHQPLHLTVTQQSYSWSLPGIRDIVFINYTITNIGDDDLTEMYIGEYVDCDVGSFNGVTIAQDDLAGYLDQSGVTLPCLGEYQDDAKVAWIADNDGDPTARQFDLNSVTGVTGLTLLTDWPGAKTSYNWWISNASGAYDFGPSRRDNVRDFTTGGTGTPAGDRNKYWQLSNGSIDFNQIYTATIGPNDPIWLPPLTGDPVLWTRGMDTRHSLSNGPYELPAGRSLQWSVAYLAAEHFHTDPENFSDNLAIYNPSTYEANLEFSDLAYKSMLARHVYDNPGVDTDSDGYAGEYVMCGGDTIWIRGDGLPDWNPNMPPHAPAVRAERDDSTITVRFNGLAPETEYDLVTLVNQFEGYSLYLADVTGEATPSVSRLAVYDRENYVKYYYESTGWQADYRLYTLTDLRCAYGGNCNDTDFYPLFYTPSDPYVVTGADDSLLYFERYGYNNSGLTGPGGFVKNFIDQPYPSTLDPSQAQPDELTEDGYFKYFEYEYVIRNLSADRDYEVAVTSFESGSPDLMVARLESDMTFITPTPAMSCCVGIRGNINGDGEVEADPLDLAYMVDFMFSGGNEPPCPAEADLNGLGDGADTADLSLLVDFLFSGGASPAPCEQ